MKIFIIGGTGFISSSLVKKLVKKNYEVTLFTRGKSRLNFENSNKINFIYGDRDNEASLKSAVSDKTYDVVVDMVAYLPEQSEKAYKIFCGKTKRFVHCSTISVYMVSNDVKIPITEDQDKLPVMPYFHRNPFGMVYGVNKRKCEDVLWNVHNENTFPVTMLRPTYVSGPKDPAMRDYFWIERILDGGPLLVPGTGNHKFQEVYVEDVAEAFLKAIENDNTIGKAYNVAQEEAFTLNEYLQNLGRLLNKNPEIHYMEQKKFYKLPISISKEGDVFTFNTRVDAVFSLERIKKDLGYNSTPFDIWMNKTIDWFTKEFKGHSVGYKYRNKELEIIKELSK